MGRVLVCLLAGGLALGMLSGCGSKVTKSNYDKVTTGMTVQQVQGILGTGQEQAGGGIGNLTGKVMVWKSGDKKITVTFVNDKVTAKAESGL